MYLKRALIKIISLIIRVVFGYQYYQFRRSLEKPCLTQEKLLAEIIQDCSKSIIGKKYALQATDSYQEFKKKLPTVTYDEITELISNSLDTGISPYSSDVITHVQYTSGSSQAKKKIPYTKSTMRSFKRCFILWVVDYLKNHQDLSTGKVFISATPHFLPEQAQYQSIRDDEEYLPSWLRFLLKPFLVDTRHLKNIVDPKEYRRQLADLLKKQNDLEVISVWSPTFLLVLLEEINDNNCWPQLKLISCWTDAVSKTTAEILQQKFPTVMIQGKGLLATEGPMTIPMSGANGAVPLIEDVFFEFLDSRGELKELSQLENNREYELIISMKGGLLRYKIGDWVRVDGYYRNTPCLRFIGRGNSTCDLVGEKLTSKFAETIIEEFISPGNYLLIPTLDKNGSGQYVIFTDQSGCNEETIDLKLQTSPYYYNARMNLQLSKIKIIHLTNFKQKILDGFIHLGMRLGNIKDQKMLFNPDVGNKLFQRLDRKTSVHCSLEKT